MKSAGRASDNSIADQVKTVYRDEEYPGDFEPEIDTSSDPQSFWKSVDSALQFRTVEGHMFPDIGRPWREKEPPKTLVTEDFNALASAEQRFEVAADALYNRSFRSIDEAQAGPKREWDYGSKDRLWEASTDLAFVRNKIAHVVAADYKRAKADPSALDESANRARLLITAFGPPPSADKPELWPDWAAVVSSAEHVRHFSPKTANRIFVEDIVAAQNLQRQADTLQNLPVEATVFDLDGHPAPSEAAFENAPEDIANRHGLSLRYDAKAINPKFEGRTAMDLIAIVEKSDRAVKAIEQSRLGPRVMALIGSAFTTLGLVTTPVPVISGIAFGLAGTSYGAAGVEVAQKKRYRNTAEIAEREFNLRLEAVKHPKPTRDPEREVEETLIQSELEIAVAELTGTPQRETATPADNPALHPEQGSVRRESNQGIA